MFYFNFNGSKRPSVVKQLPELGGETIERDYENKTEMNMKPSVKYQRLFLFEEHEKTGQSFSKTASLNMKNFSNVLIGSSDDIRNIYERKAHEKVLSPKNGPQLMFPSGGPMLFSPKV
jgi:hypothetical protein